MKNIFALIIVFFLLQPVSSQNTLIVEPAFEVLSKYTNIRDFTLSATGDEGYFTLQSPVGEVSVLMRIRFKDNRWQEPEIVPFSGKYKDLEAFISPDGLKLYFASNRPLHDSVSPPKDFDIWVSERKSTKNEWNTPVNLGAPVNSEYNEYYPSVAMNNNLYFTSDIPGTKGHDDIFFCTWENNRYSSPISLSESINSEGYEFNSYIAPDESFIIFSGHNRKDGFGNADLYISLRNKNNNWSTATNAGKHINSRYLDYCPFVDLKTKTLYFTSKRSSLAEVNDFKSMGDIEKQINKYENGLSRIYKVSFEDQLERLKQTNLQ